MCDKLLTCQLQYALDTLLSMSTKGSTDRCNMQQRSSPLSYVSLGWTCEMQQQILFLSICWQYRNIYVVAQVLWQEWPHNVSLSSLGLSLDAAFCTLRLHKCNWLDTSKAVWTDRQMATVASRIFTERAVQTLTLCESVPIVSAEHDMHCSARTKFACS